MDHFQSVGVADPHRVNVVGGIGDEMEEMRGGGDDLGGGFAEVLAEFTPEGVEHEFGRGFSAGVFWRSTTRRGRCPRVLGRLGCTPMSAQGSGPNRDSQRILA